MWQLRKEPLTPPPAHVDFIGCTRQAAESRCERVAGASSLFQ